MVSFLWLILVIFVIAVVVILQVVHRWRKKAFWELGRRYGGLIDEGGWFRRAEARDFLPAGGGVLVSEGLWSFLGWYRLKILFPWPEQSAAFRLGPRSSQRPALGSSVESIDAFSDRYRLDCRDRILKNELLCGATRLAVGRFDHRVNYDRWNVAVRYGQVTLRMPAIWSDPQPVAVALEAAFDLYFGLLESRAAGIEYTDAGVVAQRVEQAICQVCGEGVSGARDIFLCAGCGSPHHDECWQFMGRCGTYGCRSAHYRWLPIVPISPTDPRQSAPKRSVA